MHWTKIIGIAVIAAILLFVIFKVIIVLVKVVSFLLTVALFLIPAAIGYWVYTKLKKK